VGPGCEFSDPMDRSAREAGPIGRKEAKINRFSLALDSWLRCEAYRDSPTPAARAPRVSDCGSRSRCKIRPIITLKIKTRHSANVQIEKTRLLLSVNYVPQIENAERFCDIFLWFLRRPRSSCQALLRHFHRSFEAFLRSKYFGQLRISVSFDSARVSLQVTAENGGRLSMARARRLWLEISRCRDPSHT